MNGLVTDSMQMGAACWALTSLHPPPTPSIYDQIPLKGILRYLGICCKDS